VAVKQQQSPEEQVDALLGGGQDVAAQVDALLAGPKPRQLATTEKAGGVFTDSLLNLPPGQYGAAGKVASTTTKGRHPRDPRLLSDTVQRSFPNAPLVGKKPTVADMDAVAERDPAFAAEWAKLKELQAGSVKLAEGQDFTKNRASLEAETQASPFAEAAGGRAATTPTSGYGAPSPKEQKAESQKAQIKAAEIPGIHRPPISDDELAQAGFSLLREEIGKQQETLPGAGKAVLRGAASGVKLGASALVPGGGLGVFGKGVAQGAALSGTEQALGLASGAQEELEPFRLVTEALTFGVASKAGEAAALAIPKAAKTAATVGTLGTFEAVGAAEKAIKGEPLGGSGQSLLEHGIETGVAVLTGGVLAGGSHGKPSEAKILEAQLRNMEGPSNYASTVITAESLRQTIRNQLEKIGVQQTSPKVAEIKGRINDEILPLEVEVARTSREYNEYLDRQAEGDAQKRAILADSLVRTIETDGQMPVPRVVAPEQFAEGMRLLRNFGRSGLPLGELLTDLERIPEGRYQHKSESAPDQATVLTKMAEPDLLNEFKRRVTEEPAGNHSDITNELARRVVTADNPKQYAEELQSLAAKNAFGPKTPYGNTTLEDAVNQAVERALPAAGRDTGRFGRPPLEPEKAPSLNITKREFDQGYLDTHGPDGKIVPGVPGMKVSRAEAASGKYGDLVGGLRYHQQRGFYFPQVTPESEAVPGSGNLPIRQDAKPKGPLSAKNKLATDHLKGREKTFAQVMADPNRTLDTSPGAVLKVLQNESGAIRDGLVLKYARDDGLVLRTEQLPDMDVRASAAADALALRAKIKEMEAAIGKLPAMQQLALRQEINAAHRQVAELRSLAEGSLYKQAVGKQWGEYDGLWIHRDILRQARMSRDAQGQFATAMRELDGFIKNNIVGLNLNQWLPDWLGNVMSHGTSGVNMLPDVVNATKVMAGKGKISVFDDEFFAQAKSANLGGTTLDIGSRDLRDTKTIDKMISSEREQGRNVGWLLLAKGIASRGKLADKLGVGWLKPFKWVGLISKGRQALVDMAQNLAAYNALRKRGVDESGPMSPTEAFRYLQGTSDYGTLPGPIQALAVPATFIRFSSKVIQGLATRALVRRPSILGVPLPTPMDAVITAAPGSGRAQAALVGRGIMRLATTGVQWIGPILAAQTAALGVLGQKKEALDEYLDSKYDYLPAHVRWLLKQTTIPVWKNADGFYTVEVGKMFPSLVALRYFWLGGGDGGASWMWNAVQKNILAGTAAKIIARKDAFGRNVAPGIGPGEQWWPLVEIMTPALATRAITAYAQEARLPPEERHVLMSLAKNMAGAPLALLRNPDFRQAMVDRYIEAGVIGKMESTEGFTQLYVIAPNTPEGMEAEKWLDSMKRIPIDGFRAEMKARGKMERKAEDYGVKK